MLIGAIAAFVATAIGVVGLRKGTTSADVAPLSTTASEQGATVEAP